MRIYNRALSSEEIEEIYFEVQGLYRAFAPNPADGTIYVDPNVVLSWEPGVGATSHDVYLGTDYSDVNNANTSSTEYMGNFDVNSFDPCGLGIGTTYYWRIDEVNDANSDVWKGEVWNFKTMTPLIEVSATQFVFEANEGGVNPVDQVLGISNSGAGTLNWQISEDCDWLSAEPNSGSSTGEADNVNLSVDISGLTGGSYNCNLTVSDSNAGNSPQTVGVSLRIIGLVSWWKFDECTGQIAHDSAGNNNGNLINNSDWAIGISGCAVHLEGYYEFVNVEDPADGSLDFGATDSFTLSIWFNRVSEGPEHSLISKTWSSTAGPLNGYGCSIYNDKLYFRIEDTGDIVSKITGNTFITANKWHHAAFVRDTLEDKLYIYLDGVSDAIAVTDTTETTLSNGWDFSVGSWKDHPELTGKIDDVRVYNKALSSVEIKEIYRESTYKAFGPNPADGTTGVDPNVVLGWELGLGATSHDVYLGTDYSDVNNADIYSAEYMGNFDVNSFDPCGLGIATNYFWRIDEVNDANSDVWKGDVWNFITYYDPNLISLWKLDDGSGTTAKDSAGSNNGTLLGNPQWTTGKIGGALSLDGSGDCIRVTDNPTLDPTSFTISAWIYANGTPDDLDTIIDKHDENAFGYLVRINQNKKLHTNVRVAGGTSYSVVAPDVFPINQWVFVAWSYDSTSTKIYINDSMVNEASGGVQDSSSGNNFIIGSMDGIDRFFNGVIDDVRIYKKVLSGEEIKEIYHESIYKAFGPNPVDGATGVDPNVVLGWEPGIGATSHDVYLGTDYIDVNDANTSSTEYMGNFDVTSFDPCGLEIVTTYYWRIDEVNDSNSDVWKGDVWSFKTISQLIDLSSSWFEFIDFDGEVHPNNQILEITNVGVGTLNWIASCDCNWLVVEPNSGVGMGEIDEVVLSIDANGLATGIYNCELTISDANADNSPQTAAVTLYVIDGIPVMLNYDAEAYAYAYAEAWDYGDSDTKQGSSSNSKVEAHAEAYDDEVIWCGPQDKFFVEQQESDMLVSAEGIYDSNGALFESRMQGWGWWDWYDDCSSTGDSGTGDGDGNGDTSLTGKMVIGAFEYYPFGSPGLSLKCDAKVLGDSSSSWGNWDWWLKIWDDDPNNPLVSMDDGNVSATINILAGQILNFEFYHEAEKIYWPEAGLDSTLRIDFTLESIPDSDLDGDGDVDFEDFVILALQWQQAPTEPSADIAPTGGDGIVDGLDLKMLVDYWLWPY